MTRQIQYFNSKLLYSQNGPSLYYLSQHELHLGQCSPPNAWIPSLKFWNTFVEEVDQVGVDGLQDGDGGHGVEVGTVPLVQQRDVVTHCHWNQMRLVKANVKTDDCCEFWPALGCCVHPKASQNTCFGRFQPFFVQILTLLVIFHLKSRKTCENLRTG